MWQPVEAGAVVLPAGEEVARHAQVVAVKAGVGEALWQSLEERLPWDVLRDLANYALVLQEEQRARGALMRALVLRGMPLRQAYQAAYFGERYDVAS